MEKKPKSFEFLNKSYKAKFKWSASQEQQGYKPVFACCKQESQKNFVLSKNQALNICEDFQESSYLSEISIEKMQLISIDHLNSHDPTVVCSFSTGHLLIMDPTKRKKGPIKWINTKKKPYSENLPLFCRWATNSSFLVLFGDNLLWEFSINLTVEDEEFIKSAKYLTKNISHPISIVRNPDSKSNPANHWKLSLGRISEIQLGPCSKCDLLAALTEKSIKIVNFRSNTHIATLFSYFANFTCFIWSPDGEVLIAGGEDDCIHAWDTSTWQLVFRGLGHSSWVSSISCQFDGFTYIIASVGQDGNLLIWERFRNCEAIHVQGQNSNPVLTTYPKKQNHPLIEPILSIQVSQVPLEKVVLHNQCLFIFDCQGILNMWINING